MRSISRADFDDVLVAVGVALVAVGAFLAWVPAGFVTLGAALIWIVRYGWTEE
ncbi:MAG TPA: hypothetical protein VLM76_02265 [Patescibacteria group bacterium]|nr:hypothetical protein [Patescibacteria group bacterium]